MAFFLSVCLSAVVTHMIIRENGRTSPYALYDVVFRQVGAFQRADYSAAYTHAAADVRGSMRLSDFAGVVNSHYLPLLKSERLEFGSMRIRGKQAQLKVYLIDSKEIVTPCEYSLVRENGDWKIRGVRMYKSWPKDYRLSGLRT